MIPKNISSVGLIPLHSASPGFLFFSQMLILLTRSLNSSNLAVKASRICEEPVVLGPRGRLKKLSQQRMVAVVTRAASMHCLVRDEGKQVKRL